MHPNFAIANIATYHIYTSPSKHEREREGVGLQYVLSLSTDRRTSYTTTANISLGFILHNQQIFIELCIELIEQLYYNLNIQIHTTGGGLESQMFDAKEEFNRIRYSEKLTAKNRLLQKKANESQCGESYRYKFNMKFVLCLKSSNNYDTLTLLCTLILS